MTFDLKTLTARLRGMNYWREQHETAGIRARERYDKLLADEPSSVYRPDAHKADILSRMTQEEADAAKVRAEVSAHWAEAAARRAEPELRALRQSSQRAPDSISAWLAVTGGDRKFLPDEVEISAETAHEVRLLRLQGEAHDWTPSQVRATYQRALGELQDVATVRPAASLVQFIESRYGNGWSGPVANADDRKY